MRKVARCTSSIEVPRGGRVFCQLSEHGPEARHVNPVEDDVWDVWEDGKGLIS